LVCQIRERSEKDIAASLLNPLQLHHREMHQTQYEIRILLRALSGRPVSSQSGLDPLSLWSALWNGHHHC
jgi:hypothetical protein